MNWQTGMVGSIVAGIGGSAGSAILGALTRSLAGIDSLIGRTLTTPFVAAIGAMGVAIGALTLISRSANAEFTRLGRAMADLHGATGIGAGASGNIVNRFSAFGLNAGSMMGGQSAMQMAMTARMFGLPGQGSAGFIPALAGQFQGMSASGPFGHMEARSRLEALGMDTPEVRRVLTSPLDSLNRQAAFQSRVQSGLGVDPEMIARVTQQFDLMNARLTTLGSGILVRIASETLPRLNNSLEQFSNYLANNAEQIGTAISGGINAGFDAAKNFGLFMYADFPVMLNSASLSVVEFAMRTVETMPAIRQSFTEMLIGMRADIAAISADIGPILKHAWERLRTEVLGGGATGSTGHPTVDMTLRARGPIDLISRVTEPVRSVTEGLLKKLGVPDDWAALGGLAIPTLGAGAALRYGVPLLGKALFGGGAAAAGAAGAAGAGAAGAGAAGGILTPYLLPAAAAAALLGVGMYGQSKVYNWAQERGILNPGRGYLESLQRGIGRAADLFTGNHGHYDKAAYEYEQAEAARMRATAGGPSAAAARIARSTSASLGAVLGPRLPDFDGLGASVRGLSGNYSNGSISAGLQRLHDSLTKQGQELGTSAERRATLEAYLARIARAGEVTASNTGKTVDSMGCMRGSILQEAEDNAVNNAVQGVLGISGSGGY